jgi:hypothetical protein
MGQKSNLLTLKSASLPHIFASNSKIFFSIYKFVELLTRLFFSRGVWVIKKTFQIDNNFIFVNLALFFYNHKITLLKNKNFVKKQQDNFLSQKRTKSLFFNLLQKYCLKYKLNSFLFNFKVLNGFVKKKPLSFLFKKLKYFISFMFARRFNLFLDFLKITSLFIDNLLTVSTYTVFLCQIFKNISHRLHNKYFAFLKTLFKLILNFSEKRIGLNSDINKPLAGFKLIISGRLRNKDRSSSRLLLLGSIPTHSFSKDIDFASSPVHTLYGVFGFKLWAFRKNIHNT